MQIKWNGISSIYYIFLRKNANMVFIYLLIARQIEKKTDIYYKWRRSGKSMFI